MGDSWITIVAMVAFFFLPIIFGNKKKPESAGEVKNELEEFLSQLGMDELPEEESDGESEEIFREVYKAPEMKVRVVPVKESEKKVKETEVENSVKVGSGMSKEEKRKLVIYSEVMSPKYKEY